TWTSITSKLNLRIIVSYFYIVLSVFRFLFAATSLNLHSAVYFRYDPFNHLFLQMGLLDRYLTLVVWPAPLFLLYLDYLVSFTRYYRIYYLAYDLLVLNRQDFAVLNPRLLANNGWQSWFAFLFRRDDSICSVIRFK